MIFLESLHVSNGSGALVMVLHIYMHAYLMGAYLSLPSGTSQH